MNRKQQQLGMNPGTAAHRLRKNLLFKFVVDAGCKCYRCGEALTLDTFSVEHKTPWLDSDDPVRLFFDLDNVAFSHQACNSYAADRTRFDAANLHRGKTHCKRGHLLDERNTRVQHRSGRKERSCKRCHADRLRRERAVDPSYSR